MPESIVTLYSNDPMGKRWQQNLAAASRAEAELGATVVVVRKTSAAYRPGIDPPCPSVAVNDRVIARDGTVDFETLKAELGKG